MAKRKIDDPSFEISFYENILQEKGDFIEALIALGDLYTRNGFYEKGLEVDRKLSSLRPEDPVILYNLACSYSLLQDADRSLGAIKLALENGYDEYDYLEQDMDLEFLRKDSRFQEFFHRFRKEQNPQNRVR